MEEKSSSENESTGLKLMWVLGFNLYYMQDQGSFTLRLLAEAKVNCLEDMLPQHRPQEVFTDFFKSPIKENIAIKILQGITYQEWESVDTNSSKIRILRIIELGDGFENLTYY